MIGHDLIRTNVLMEHIIAPSEIGVNAKKTARNILELFTTRRMHELINSREKSN